MSYYNHTVWTTRDTLGLYRVADVPARKQNMKINRNEEVPMHQIISDYAATKAAISVYEEFGMDVPGNLKETLRVQRIEIERRVEDSLRAKLAAAEARLEAIKTAEEKRSGLREEIAALKAKLAKKGE